ncbi:hypothetical protein [Sorangium sp. So ce128]|uniref:hypothetical protein n=1 Tax=Sorangium sp. So ce128 TaxID=3133281 RepID=UPI003F633315
MLGTKLSLRDIFVVPGNHDVAYDAEDMETRIVPYANFYNKLFAGTRPPILPHEASKVTQVHVDKGRGSIVVEINSAHYVQKGTPDEKRGSVDMQMIRMIDEALTEARGVGQTRNGVSWH